MLNPPTALIELLRCAQVVGPLPGVNMRVCNLRLIGSLPLFLLVLYGGSTLPSGMARSSGNRDFFLFLGRVLLLF